MLIPTISVGQILNDSLLSTFYNKTISLYFADSTYNNLNPKFKNILIQTDLDTTQLVKYWGNNKFLYFNEKTSYSYILEKPIKSNKGRPIYWINHKMLSNDTIDINIGGWTLNNVTKKKISLAAWCGGTMGYIPNCRFISNNMSKSWVLITEQEIINQKNDYYKKNNNQ